MKKSLINAELFIKIGFILVSILSMSTLINNSVSAIYKFFTFLLVIINIIIFLKNYRDNYFDKKYIILILLLLISQIITSFINSNENLLGNLIEVVFMFSYCLIMAITFYDNKDKLFEIVCYIVQAVSFILGILTFIFLMTRTTIIWISSKNIIYYYGILDGRIWSFINPNSAAILSYISIFTALFLINTRKEKRNIMLKINIIIQIIFFSIQQSRGALLSILFIVIVYCIFITRENYFYRRIIKSIIYILIIIGIILSLNKLTNYYIINYPTRKIFLNKDFKKTDEPLEEFESILNIEQEGESKSRLISSSASGRLHIWKTSIEMFKNKPLFGYGARNIPKHYNKYYDEFLIKNSLIGGNFHNIYITSLISSGLLGFISFMSVIIYILIESLKYLIKGNSIRLKILILLLIALLAGQMFESTILYSTSFINIFFWFTTGYFLISLKQEENNFNDDKKLIDINELRNIEVEILDYVVSLCEKLELKYWLAYGTLIGAIRHNGFIPWDDDIDICMFRDDYEKLQSYMIENPDSRFKLMSYKNNKNYVYQFIKVIDSNTYISETSIFPETNMGVYIDIFPIDGHDYNEKIPRVITKLNKKRKLSTYSFYGIYNEKSVLSTIIRNISILLFSFKNPQKYLIKINELAMSRKVEDHLYADYVMDIDTKRPTMKKEFYEDLIDWEFCGKTYKVPLKYDDILRIDYGDYTKLPPEDKRVTHHNFIAWKK